LFFSWSIDVTTEKRRFIKYENEATRNRREADRLSKRRGAYRGSAMMTKRRDDPEDKYFLEPRAL
jgi:hypothetical protein